MAAGIKKFIEHYKDDVPADALQYEAGIVVDDEYGFAIGWEQYGAEETFSVGQPVYDEHGNIMGYLGIGLYSNLDYSTDESIRIPVSFWQICLPTQHCKAGKKVFTFWQEKKRIEEKTVVFGETAETLGGYVKEQKKARMSNELSQENILSNIR